MWKGFFPHCENSSNGSCEMKRLVHAFRKSPWLACKVVVDRVADWKEERRLNIRTAGFIPIENLMEDWQGNHDYAPTSIAAFRAFMCSIELTPGRDALVDFGCGKGRVLVLAAQYPFARVIGVEVAPALAGAARTNSRRANLPIGHPPIEIWQGSAEAFLLPSDASVIFLANPFRGRVLLGVLENIRTSLIEYPRRLQLIYYNPFRLKAMIHKFPWLIERQAFDLEKECVIYEADAAIAASCGIGQLDQTPEEAVR
jgi:SAM-dependent methyltransferase